MPRRLLIPPEITIRGRRWRIYQEPSLPEWATMRRLRAEGIDGLTYREQREIHLARGMSRRRREVALVHEILHACGRARDIPCAYEEAVIEDVDAPLLDVIGQLEWIE